MVIMMQNNIIKLVKKSSKTNDCGDIQIEITEREIFAEEKSIGYSEFYQAQVAGMKAEIKFELSDYLEYEGETMLKYQPYNGTEEEYSVIRTYRQGNKLEIICRKGVENVST